MPPIDAKAALYQRIGLPIPRPKRFAYAARSNRHLHTGSQPRLDCTRHARKSSIKRPPVQSITGRVLLMSNHLRCERCFKPARSPEMFGAGTSPYLHFSLVVRARLGSGLVVVRREVGPAQLRLGRSFISGPWSIRLPKPCPLIRGRLAIVVIFASLFSEIRIGPTR